MLKSQKTQERPEMKRKRKGKQDVQRGRGDNVEKRETKTLKGTLALLIATSSTDTLLLVGSWLNESRVQFGKYVA